MKVAERGTDLIDRITDGKVSGRNPVALQKFLGEALARLKLRGGLGRAEDAPSPAVELIHDTEGERKFGAYHGQVRPQARGELRHGVEILEIGGQAFGILGDTAVAGSAIELRNARGLAQLPHQCVFASAPT